MPPQSERRQEMIAFAQDELKKYQEGEISALSTYRALGERFGFRSAGNTSLILERGGVMRKGIRETSANPIELTLPSQEFAWLLGALSGGGSVDGRGIELGSKSEELVQVFKSTAENLFHTNVIVQPRRINNKGRISESQLASIYNRKLAQFVGDLRRNQWPTTLIQNHGWIMERDQYIWNFLEGFFDLRGRVYSYPERGKHQISLNTPSNEASLMLANMLTRVDLNILSIGKNKSNRGGVDGINIYNLLDIKRFAQNVHSKVPEKEKQLEYYRDRGSQVGKSVIHTEEELILEWNRISQLFGRNPTSREIDNLQKQGETVCSATVFSKRFGGGSFIEARQNLGEMLGIEIYHESQRRKYRQRSQSGEKATVYFLDAELMQVWREARASLGHAPTYTEFQSLYRQGKVGVGACTYAKRFGEGSFVKARENLERIIAEQAVETSGEQPIPQEVQVFPDS